MSFETGLVSYLEVQVPSVSNRIYSAPLPEGVTLPALTYFRINGAPTYSHGGSSNLVSPRYQIDAWALTAASRSAVSAEVVAALSGTKGLFGDKTAQASFANDPGSDFYEADTQRYQRMMEFEIYHAEDA